MCKRDERTELVSLYTLLGRIGKIEILRKAFLEYLKVRPSSLSVCARLYMATDYLLAHRRPAFRS
jgi:hypothetical protein